MMASATVGLPPAETQDLAALFNARRFQELEVRTRELTDRDPTLGLAWKLMGIALGVQGKDALPALHRAAELLADDAEVHSNLGNALLKTGRLQEAADSCRRALQINANFADAHNNLGNALRGLGSFDESVSSYRRALQLKPQFTEAHSNLGNALSDLGRLDDAVDSYHQALHINPQYAQAHSNLGNALLKLGQPDAALDSCHQALRLRPQYAEAHNNLGNTLLNLGRYEEAAASYREALRLRPQYAEAYSNLGSALLYLDRADEAGEALRRALQIAPNFPEPYNHQGNVLAGLGQLDEALNRYQMAIALKPEYAEARFNRSLVLLLREDFDCGWTEYEWRRKLPSSKADRGLVQPLWLGHQPLVDKTILLYAEQGLGDTIQFCRYAEPVAALGGDVVLQVQRPLTSLLAGLNAVTRLISNADALPAVDYQCALLSLPLAFKATLDTIPSSKDGYLRSDATKVARWQAKLGVKRNPRVGLVWSGNPKHKRDRDRSIALDELLQHLPKGPQYISLQKDIRAADQATLQAHPQVLDFGNELQDFSDTAALCDCLDLIISVDTSVAHLSGALGKRTWILLPYVPDWRWLLHRGDSPWYPTATLYRQDRQGDWTEVFERIRADLGGNI
jgi:hypothetical protein